MAFLTRRVLSGRKAVRFAVTFAALSGLLTAPAFGQALRNGLGPRPLLLDQTVGEETPSYVISNAVRSEMNSGIGSSRWLAAGVGGVVGSVATYLALNAGGSTASCDQSANQDAIDTGPCLGLYALGGLAGAGLGLLVRKWIANDP